MLLLLLSVVLSLLVSCGIDSLRHLWGALSFIYRQISDSPQDFQDLKKCILSYLFHSVPELPRIEIEFQIRNLQDFQDFQDFQDLEELPRDFFLFKNVELPLSGCSRVVQD